LKFALVIFILCHKFEKYLTFLAKNEHLIFTYFNSLFLNFVSPMILHLIYDYIRFTQNHYSEINYLSLLSNLINTPQVSCQTCASKSQIF